MVHHRGCAVYANVPLDRRGLRNAHVDSSPAGVDAWLRMRHWVWMHAAAVLAPAVIVCTGDFPVARKALGVVLAVLSLTVRIVWERRLFRIVDGRRGTEVLLFTAVIIAIAAAMFAVHPLFFFSLFALFPLCFTTIDGLWQQRVAAVLLTLITVVGTAGWGDWTASSWLVAAGQGTIILIFSLGTSQWISGIIDESRSRRQLLEQLEASKSEIAQLHHDAGIQAERQRLAADIHDTLAQGFTSIVMLVQGARTAIERDPDKAHSLLELAEHTARENLTEARTVVAALQPAALQSASLPDALRRLAVNFRAETEVNTTVAVNGEARTLPASEDVVLLRSAQEALTNIRKHAYARTVIITLDYERVGVRLAVVDDGHGFDADAQTSGFGLSGMRNRVAQVGGAMRLDTSPGRGTDLQVSLP